MGLPFLQLGIWGWRKYRVKSLYLAPRGLARANPLPLLPGPVPRTDPRLAVPVTFSFSPPPRLLNAELGRDVGAGVVYLDEAVGRLDT